MKIGMRTPNFSKMLKERTTGKLKRSINKTINPLYGKKGIGLIKNPYHSIHNKMYKKATFSIFNLFRK